MLTCRKVTGCSSGIGLALAKHIATKTPSQRVVATARNLASLSASISGLPDAPNVLKLALDVTSFTSIETVFNTAVHHFGRLDVVVNNAGYNLIGDAEAWRRGNADARALFDTNFWGAVDVTKRALAVFRSINRGSGQQGGVIVNMTCAGEDATAPGSAFYKASKSALEGFAKTVAKEVAPEWNIHVVNIECGAVRSTNHATTSLRRMRRHPAYVGNLNCAANRVIGFMAVGQAHKAALEPEDVAKRIYMAVETVSKMPIRVPLGQVAWDMIHEEMGRMDQDLDDTWDISRAIGDVIGKGDTAKETTEETSEEETSED